MGVRTDARPFIAWSDQSEEYLGFFWDICTEAVDRAGYTIATKVQVDATLRADFLNKGIGDYDLLCDPTTITLERMRRFADEEETAQLEFSPIVFVANGSFVQQERGAPDPAGRGRVSGAATREMCDDLIAGLELMAPPAVDRRGIALRLPRNAGRDYTDFEIWAM